MLGMVGGQGQYAGSARWCSPLGGHSRCYMHSAERFLSWLLILPRIIWELKLRNSDNFIFYDWVHMLINLTLSETSKGSSRSIMVVSTVKKNSGTVVPMVLRKVKRWRMILKRYQSRHRNTFVIVLTAYRMNESLNMFHINFSLVFFINFFIATLYNQHLCVRNIHMFLQPQLFGIFVI